MPGLAWRTGAGERGSVPWSDAGLGIPGDRPHHLPNYLEHQGSEVYVLGEGRGGGWSARPDPPPPQVGGE